MDLFQFSNTFPELSGCEVGKLDTKLQVQLQWCQVMEINNTLICWLHFSGFFICDASAQLAGVQGSASHNVQVLSMRAAAQSELMYGDFSGFM